MVASERPYLRELREEIAVIRGAAAAAGRLAEPRVGLEKCRGVQLAPGQSIEGVFEEFESWMVGWLRVLSFLTPSLLTIMHFFLRAR